MTNYNILWIAQKLINPKFIESNNLKIRSNSQLIYILKVKLIEQVKLENKDKFFN